MTCGPAPTRTRHPRIEDNLSGPASHRRQMGLHPRIGGAISAAIAIGILLPERAGRHRPDRGRPRTRDDPFATYIAVSPGRLVGRALRNVVLPKEVSFLAITTLARRHHRWPTAATPPPTACWTRASPDRRTSATSPGLHQRDLITGVMRIILFLAIFGVVTSGAELDTEGQASAFPQAARGRDDAQGPAPRLLVSSWLLGIGWVAWLLTVLPRREPRPIGHRALSLRKAVHEH